MCEAKQVVEAMEVASRVRRDKLHGDYLPVWQASPEWVHDRV